MQKKNIPFEQVCDIIAFRIIVDNIEDCYKALGVIHTKYPMIGGRYKDYISTPKQNGYRSLHTGVIGPLNRRIEVQIRSKDMDKVAELGVAAHWEYKQGATKEGTQYRWLRDLLDLMNRCSDPNDFLEHTKIALYQDQVFCFSPKGDLITLPQGATAIDFAYAVHSRVGDTCVGVKINGKITPLRTELKNGDQVEVLTNKNQTPSPEWEHIAVTAKAKASIRRFIRAQQYEQNIQNARNMFLNETKYFGLSFNDKELQPLIQKYKSFLKAGQDQVDDLLAAIGAGVVSFKDVFHELHPECSKSTLKKALSLFKKKEQKPEETNKNMPVVGLIPGISLNFAKCCHPIPGDSIVGIITTGKGVTIHTVDCTHLNQYQEEPERWIPVEWNSAMLQNKILPARICLEVEDKPSVLSEITTITAKQNIAVTNLKIQNRKNGLSEIILEVEVKDSSSLDLLLQSFRSCQFVSNVHRLKF